MSLKVEIPFDSSQLSLDKNRRIKTFMATTLSPYQTYVRELEINAKKLKQKYHFKQESELKTLLEELQNDMQTATAILEGEAQIKEMMDFQPLNQNDRLIDAEYDEQKYLTAKSDNHFLKRALNNLYRKYSQFKVIEKQQSQSIEKNSKELQSLVRINVLLSSNQGEEEDHQCSTRRNEEEV